MKHTNVFETEGLRGTFVGFPFGGPLNEAALAGSVDVVLTADQPAATLLARDGAFTIVGRLMYNRVAIYVPPDSPIQEVADLQGTRVAMPFGAAAQRDALAAIEDAGLDPATDIEAVNLDVLEQAAIVQGGTSSSWGDLDALVGFDPTPAIFEAQGQARMLHVGQVVAVVMLADEFLADEEVARRFLRAYVKSWAYYAQNQDEANEWFKAESGLSFEGSGPLEIAASVEPNVDASTPEELRTTLSDADLAVLQEAADFIADRELVPTRVTMADHVDQSLMTAVAGEITEADLDGIRASDP
jgi:ABC-type nitrate/sulfonate/bicarbonate transport system substrate-binding protein